MTDWTPPYPPQPAPEPIVPFGTVLTRVIMTGGFAAIETLVSMLGDDEENATRLLNALEGISPTDESARQLLLGAGLDPDVILYFPEAP